MNRFHLRDDRGSLPLALLAVIVIGGILTALTSVAIGGQRYTGFDQNYEQSLQTAEVGLSRMLAQVESGAQNATFSLNEGNIQGQAVREANGDWLIQATGTAPNGETNRTVETRVTTTSVFQYAAFGKVFSNVNGNNGVESYRSGRLESGVWTPAPYTGGSPDAYMEPGVNTLRAGRPDDDQGFVGTNRELFIKGGLLTPGVIDGAFIHNAMENVADPLPDATGYCQGANQTCWAYGVQRDTNEDLADGNRMLEYVREPFPMPEVAVPNATDHFNGDGGFLGPGNHYHTSATLYSNTVIQGTPDNPTILWLSGQLTVPKDQQVNFTMVDGVLRPRPAGGLIIRSSSGGVAIDMQTKAEIAAGIYAPNGAFSGSSQVHVWGSVIAGSFNSVGNFNLHYDVSLADVEDGSPPVADRWIER